MTSEHITDQLLATIFRDTKTIAVVGVSANADRASNYVMKFLLDRGYHNPCIWLI